MIRFSIDRFLGLTLRFSNGLSVGWAWVHGNGETTKTSAVIAAYHRPDSITWRWALYYAPPKLRHIKEFLVFDYTSNRRDKSLMLGPLGRFSFAWQDHMFRSKTRKGADNE